MSEFRDEKYDEKDVARFRWISVVSCDPAFADRVGGEKTVVIVTEHAGTVEQSMFNMRDAQYLLRWLVYSMAVGGDKLAKQLYREHFEGTMQRDDPGRADDLDDADWWKNK